MCDPTLMFAATAAASIGGAFMGADSDISNYNKQVKAINAEAEAINKSVVFKYRLGQLQQQQIQAKAGAEIGKSKLKLVEAEGAATAAAASGGVEGVSVERLINSFNVATGSDISFINQEKDNQVAQVSSELKGIELDAKNRKQSLQYQLPDDPTSKIIGRFLNAAMQTGTAYFQATTPVKGSDGKTTRRFG